MSALNAEDTVSLVSKQKQTCFPRSLKYLKLAMVVAPKQPYQIKHPIGTWMKCQIQKTAHHKNADGFSQSQIPTYCAIRLHEYSFANQILCLGRLRLLVLTRRDLGEHMEWQLQLTRMDTYARHGVTSTKKSTWPFHRDTSFIFNGVLVGRQIRLNPWTFTLEPFKKALPTLGSFSPSCNSSCFACTWNKNYKDNNSVSTTFALNKHHWPNLIWNTICSSRLSNAKKIFFAQRMLLLIKVDLQCCNKRERQTLRQTLKLHMHSLSEYSLV